MWLLPSCRRVSQKLFTCRLGVRALKPERARARKSLTTALVFTGAMGYLTMRGEFMGFSKKVECQGTKIEFENPNVTILEHSLVPFLLSQIRDPECSTSDYRRFSDRIMHLLIEEAIAAEPMNVTIKKTLAGGDFECYRLTKTPNDFCAVTIIRAGDSMLPKMFELMPGIKVGKVLVQRDESTEDKRSVFYYSKLPKEIAKKKVFILDPMLATGGSCSLVINRLKEEGVKEENITFINLISCPEGLSCLTSAFPDIKIITAVVDPNMNEERYIEPGLGDYGDRYFNSD
ncbi:unnamed protein product [Moneuplotes crassus]|uniref:uracil phosphoribosyltransferase n=1 Tax=Euplotes crassus TaxID=5936 RepID=A0AAD1XRX5_EUPCR|nr:unnamed protein product [Moneuplotes crassus]